MCSGGGSMKFKCVTGCNYMHIAKSNGKWMIVNVLWDMKPQKTQRIKTSEAFYSPSFVYCNELSMIDKNCEVVREFPLLCSLYASIIHFSATFRTYVYRPWY